MPVFQDDLRHAKKRKKFVNVKERPIFAGYMIPQGWLLRYDQEDYLACHALFRYYISARQQYESEQDNLLAYEGDKDTVINYHGLFKGIANWYDVKPEVMAKFWHNVDMQCRVLGLPLLPDSDRYRFNKVPEIVTEEKPAEETKDATSRQD